MFLKLHCKQFQNHYPRVVTDSVDFLLTKQEWECSYHHDSINYRMVSIYMYNQKWIKLHIKAMKNTKTKGVHFILFAM